MQNITIAVRHAGTAAARTYAIEVGVKGKEASRTTLSPVQTEQAGEMAAQYLSILQSTGRDGAGEYLSILADMLFRLFLEAAWGEVKTAMSSGEETELVVASDVPEVLQLPWEWLSLSSRTEGLFSGGMGIIRCPRADGWGQAAAPVSGSLPVLAPPPLPAPGPLSLLLLSAGPYNDGDEEAALVALQGVDARLQVCESGEADELKSLAGSLHPHLVILAGQAGMAGGRAVFHLPGPAGRSHPQATEDLAAALKESGAAGLILTGRQKESAFALHLIGQKLADSIPFVLTWDATVADVVRLIRPIAEGQGLDGAIRSIRSASGLSELAASPKPHLYTIYRPSVLFDGEKRVAAAGSQQICREQAHLPGAAEGRAERFLDRRQDLHKLAPALADGAVHSLIITGPEGSGKSTLAARLACQMASSGYGVLTVYGSQYNRITAARLIDAAAAHFRAAGKEEAAKPLRDVSSSVQKRLQALLEALKGSRTLLIWDDLVLDGKTGKIADPELAAFYLQMNRGLSSSRAIITCPALPADAPTLPSRAWQWKLEGLGRAAFIRFLLGEDATAQGYRSGRISFTDLAEHHAAAIGLPDLLPQRAKALAAATDGQAFPAQEDPVARLLPLLEQPSRQALCRAAVFDVAMSPDGFAKVSGAAEQQIGGYARRWQALSLANLQEGLLSVPRPVRSALLSALSPEELVSCRRAAGDYLKELAFSGRSADIGLSRLDALLEARGLLLVAQDGAGAAEVTASVSGYLLKRGYRSELIRLNQELIASLKEMGQEMPDIAAGPAGWVARAYLDGEEYRRAEEWYSRALESSRAPAPAHYHGLGLSLLHQGKHDDARASLQKAVEGFRSVGDLSAEATALGSLAALQMKLGENDSARESLSQIAGLMKAAGDVQGEAAAWQDISRLDMMKGDLNAAREGLVRSLELLRWAGDSSGSSIALFNLASLDMEKGDFTAAGAEFEEALPFFEERGDLSGTAAIHHSLGMIHSQAGEKEKAKKSFLVTLSLSQKLGDRAAEAGAFFQLGVLAVQQNRGAEGLRLMALASVLLRSIKSDEAKNVEPLVERLAAQLGYSQEQFLAMVQEVLSGYAGDRGRALAEKA